MLHHGTSLRPTGSPPCRRWLQLLFERAASSSATCLPCASPRPCWCSSPRPSSSAYACPRGLNRRLQPGPSTSCLAPTPRERPRWATPEPSAANCPARRVVAAPPPCPMASSARWPWSACPAPAPLGPGAPADSPSPRLPPAPLPLCLAGPCRVNAPTRLPRRVAAPAGGRLRLRPRPPARLGRLPKSPCPPVAASASAHGRLLASAGSRSRRARRWPPPPPPTAACSPPPASEVAAPAGGRLRLRPWPPARLARLPKSPRPPAAASASAHGRLHRAPAAGRLASPDSRLRPPPGRPAAGRLASPDSRLRPPPGRPAAGRLASPDSRLRPPPGRPAAGRLAYPDGLLRTRPRGQPDSPPRASDLRPERPRLRLGFVRASVPAPPCGPVCLCAPCPAAPCPSEAGCAPHRLAPAPAVSRLGRGLRWPAA
nr:basic proline-rich protein-like [Aegilops tauschii subsp. strangulata]